MDFVCRPNSQGLGPGEALNVKSEKTNSLTLNVTAYYQYRRYFLLAATSVFIVPDKTKELCDPVVLSVCVSLSNVIRKVAYGFGRNFQCRPPADTK